MPHCMFSFKEEYHFALPLRSVHIIQSELKWTGLGSGKNRVQLSSVTSAMWTRLYDCWYFGQIAWRRRACRERNQGAAVWGKWNVMASHWVAQPLMINQLMRPTCCRLQQQMTAASHRSSTSRLTSSDLSRISEKDSSERFLSLSLCHVPSWPNLEWLYSPQRLSLLHVQAEGGLLSVFVNAG